MGRGGTGKEMVKLISNRRHLTSKTGKKGGFVSVIVVSQVYNMVPRVLRAQADSVWMYRNSDRGEIASISKDLIPVDKNTLNRVLAEAWSEKFAPLIINKKEGKFYKASLDGGISFEEIKLPAADWEQIAQAPDNRDQFARDADMSAHAAREALEQIDSADDQESPELRRYLEELEHARSRLRRHKRRKVR